MKSLKTGVSRLLCDVAEVALASSSHSVCSLILYEEKKPANLKDFKFRKCRK